jgi:hypothetical protein
MTESSLEKRKYKKLSIFTLCLIALISVSPIIDHYYNGPVIIEINKDKLVYKGVLSKNHVKELFRFYESLEVKPTTLAVSSKGGDGVAGGMLGAWIFKNNLNVEVTKRCLSSCAMYVFPAGKKSYLGKSAQLGWYGGYASKRVNIGDKKFLTQQQFISKVGEEAYKILLETESKYFKKIGIDPKILSYGEDEKYNKFHNNMKYNKGYVGFYYSVKDMRKMGLNIGLLHDSWIGSEANHSKYQDYFLVDLAQERLENDK